MPASCAVTLHCAREDEHEVHRATLRGKLHEWLSPRVMGPFERKLLGLEP